MQDDLISRSALSTHFAAMQECANMRDHVYLMGVLSVIDNAPAVDAVPAVHGRWIHGITLGHEWRKCSKCLVSQGIFGCFTYCPNCGAKMDAEE